MEKSKTSFTQTILTQQLQLVLFFLINPKEIMTKLSEYSVRFGVGPIVVKLFYCNVPTSASNCLPAPCGELSHLKTILKRILWLKWYHIDFSQMDIFLANKSEFIFANKSVFIFAKKSVFLFADRSVCICASKSLSIFADKSVFIFAKKTLIFICLKNCKQIFINFCQKKYSHLPTNLW